MASLLKRAARELLKPMQIAYSVPEKWLYSRGARASDSLSLPDFLGIGAPQSGTTWLFENLRCHPSIHLSRRKELHYFDRNFHRSLRYYSSRFKRGRGKVKGEITPAYSILELERIRFIRRIIPDVKLILLLRNPIDRAWSTARRILLRGDLTSGSGIEDEARLLACFMGELGKPGDYAPGLKRGDYLRIIDNWLSVFPEEQLHVGFFDDIVNRPQDLLSEIFLHIGVSPDVDWEAFPYNQVINRNPACPIPKKWRSFLEDMYRQDIERLWERFGEPVAGWRCPDKGTETDRLVATH